MPDPSNLETLATGVGTAFAPLAEQLPVVGLAAIPLALLFWGGPKLVSFFKRIAK